MQGAAAKLGAACKNKRLADIIAHRREAPVRSLKWLVGILDNVLKQVGHRMRYYLLRQASSPLGRLASRAHACLGPLLLAVHA